MTDTNTQANGQTQASASLALSPYQLRAIELREEISQDATPRAIVPRTFAEAQAFASAIANSSLVPFALKERAPDILMIVLAGAELGIAPIRSLSMFHVIEGVPKLSSEALGAIVTASPLCEYLEPRELANDRVVFAGKRRGRPEVTLAYTEEDVKRANLDRPTRNGGVSNHVKFPRDMKVARCRAALVRMLWPDLAAGITTKEEAEDLIHLRELEAAPPTAAAFTAPAPLPTPPAAKATAGKSEAKSASKSKPIDVASTETKSAGSSPTPSTSSGSTSSSSGSARPTLGAPDPGAEAALAQAREGKEAIDARSRRDAEVARRGIDEARNAAEERRRAEPTTDRDPEIVTPASDNSTAGGELGPNTRDGAPTQTQEDNVPPATADDDFGAPEPTGFRRSLEEFEKAVNAAVEAKDANRLRVIKEDWGPWSKDQSESGGFKFAHKMREIFAKAKADMGVR